MKPLRVVGPLASVDIVTAIVVLHNFAIQNRDYHHPLSTGRKIQLEDEIVGDNSNLEGRRVRQHYVASTSAKHLPKWHLP